MYNPEEETSNDTKDDTLDDYIGHLLREKSSIDEKECPFAVRFLDEEISRAQKKFVKGPPRDTRYVDLYNERPVKVSVKILFPNRQYPGFNFVGKLLGSKGSNLKQLQEKTRCFMNIQGRGSMRDREKEEELRRSCEPKYAHLSEDLHVEISALAPPAQAHSRISNALSEIRKHLSPEYNPLEDDDEMPMDAPSFRKDYSGGGGGMWQRRQDNEEHHDRSNMEFPKSEWSRRGKGNGDGSSNVRRRGGVPHGMPNFQGSSKSSVMSILNKARIAMEESHRLNQHEPAYHPKRYVEESYGY